MHPWAILFEQDVIIWSFGISEIEFPTQAKNLIMALQEFGQGLYGEGITMVEFSYSHYSQDYKGVFLSHTPDQLFVVNLSDSFLLLISDITAVVSIMPFIDVHPDMDDLLRGVLVAQGTNIYAHLILQAKSRREEEEIDHLFRKVLRLAGRKDANNLIIKGNFTLSPLSIPELLLFHTFLR